MKWGAFEKYADAVESALAQIIHSIRDDAAGLKARIENLERENADLRKRQHLSDDHLRRRVDQLEKAAQSARRALHIAPWPAKERQTPRATRQTKERRS